MSSDDFTRFDPAVPAEYIPTSKALREMAQSDARFVELSRAAETNTSAEEMAAANQAAAERLTELELSFFSAIDRGEIEVVVLDIQNNWRPVVVPGSYWHESMAGNDSIWAGQLLAFGQRPPGVPSRMAEGPVCFRRRDWSSWLATRDASSAPTDLPLSVASPLKVRATDREMSDWMLSHQSELKVAGKRHGRENVLAAASLHFELPYKVVREIWDARPTKPKAQ